MILLLYEIIFRSVPQHSALHDYLQPGDIVTDVNGCPVRSADSLRACIFAQVTPTADLNFLENLVRLLKKMVSLPGWSCTR